MIINTFYTEVKKKIMYIPKHIRGINPSYRDLENTSFTISPFIREKRVVIVLVVPSNFGYFQKIDSNRNTNPKKNGITPKENQNILDPDIYNAFINPKILGLNFK